MIHISKPISYSLKKTSTPNCIEFLTSYDQDMNMLPTAIPGVLGVKIEWNGLTHSVLQIQSPSVWLSLCSFAKNDTNLNKTE